MSGKPRILHINKLYTPYIGGIETVVQNLAENVTDRCDGEVLVCQPRGKMARDVVNGVPVTRTGSWGIVLSLPISFSFPFILRKMAPRFDLLHLHHPFPLGEISALAFARKSRMVFTWYSPILRQKWFSRAYSPFLTRLLERVERITVIYPGQEKQSPLLQKHQHKCLAVPPGINVQDYPLNDKISAQAEAIRQQYGEPLILFAGRLVYYKGMEHLIAAMPSIRGNLMVIGDGAYRKSLEQQSAKLGLQNRVHFLGHVSDDLLKTAFHACDVFVLPSTHPTEAFGMVQLEAMVCGKPVVNTSIPTGVPYVSLDRVTGLTVEPANPEALSQAVNTLLDDSELRRQYGEAGRQRVLQEFTVQRMADRIWNLYQQVLQA